MKTTIENFKKIGIITFMMSCGSIGSIKYGSNPSLQNDLKNKVNPLLEPEWSFDNSNKSNDNDTAIITNNDEDGKLFLKFITQLKKETDSSNDNLDKDGNNNEIIKVEKNHKHNKRTWLNFAMDEKTTITVGSQEIVLSRKNFLFKINHPWLAKLIRLDEGCKYTLKNKEKKIFFNHLKKGLFKGNKYIKEAITLPDNTKMNNNNSQISISKTPFYEKFLKSEIKINDSESLTIDFLSQEIKQDTLKVDAQFNGVKLILQRDENEVWKIGADNNNLKELDQTKSAAIEKQYRKFMNLTPLHVLKGERVNFNEKENGDSYRYQILYNGKDNKAVIVDTASNSNNLFRVIDFTPIFNQKTGAVTYKPCNENKGGILSAIIQVNSNNKEIRFLNNANWADEGIWAGGKNNLLIQFPKTSDLDSYYSVITEKTKPFADKVKALVKGSKMALKKTDVKLVTTRKDYFKKSKNVQNNTKLKPVNSQFEQQEQKNQKEYPYLTFKKIDKELEKYWKFLEQNDYFNNGNKGKFAQAVADQGFSEEDLVDELKEGAKNCSYIDHLIKDFPLPESLTNCDINKKQDIIFWILQTICSEGKLNINKLIKKFINNEPNKEEGEEKEKKKNCYKVKQEDPIMNVAKLVFNDKGENGSVYFVNDFGIIINKLSLSKNNNEVLPIENLSNYRKPSLYENEEEQKCRNFISNKYKEFLTKGDNDNNLSSYYDTSIYGTGIYDEYKLKSRYRYIFKNEYQNTLHVNNVYFKDIRTDASGNKYFKYECTPVLQDTDTTYLVYDGKYFYIMNDQDDNGKRWANHKYYDNEKDDRFEAVLNYIKTKVKDNNGVGNIFDIHEKSNNIKKRYDKYLDEIKDVSKEGSLINYIARQQDMSAIRERIVNEYNNEGKSESNNFIKDKLTINSKYVDDLKKRMFNTTNKLNYEDWIRLFYKLESLNSDYEVTNPEEYEEMLEQCSKNIQGLFPQDLYKDLMEAGLGAREWYASIKYIKRKFDEILLYGADEYYENNQYSKFDPIEIQKVFNFYKNTYDIGKTGFDVLTGIVNRNKTKFKRLSELYQQRAGK